MINVTVLYPSQEGSRFDMDYYLTKHTPMLAQRLGTACKGISIEQGIAGMVPSSPAFHVVCQVRFDSVEAFQAAFAPHAAEVMADIPKYTSIQPVIQFSEVKMWV